MHTYLGQPHTTLLPSPGLHSNLWMALCFLSYKVSSTFIISDSPPQACSGKQHLHMHFRYYTRPIPTAPCLHIKEAVEYISTTTILVCCIAIDNTVAYRASVKIQSIF